MKKFLTLFLMLVLLFSLTSCSKNIEDLSSAVVTESEIDTADEEPAETQEEPPQQEDPEVAQEETQKKEEPTEPTDSAAEIGSDFKEAMDSYEDFIDDYVEFMKKYQANPTDASLLGDYLTYMENYTKEIGNFNNFSSKLSADELEYYIEVQTRTSEKLLEIAQ